MSTMEVALGAFLLVFGGFLAVGGLRGVQLGHLGRPVGRPQIPLTLVLSVLVGVVVGLVTRWFVAMLAVPGLLFVLPKVLRSPKNREIATLEAIDRWVRTLAASLPTGKSIADAISATYVQCPALLKEPVALVITRLNHRWSLREALLAMANQLDSADADAVLAALILAGERGGVGATRTLNALAQSCAERLHALREVESERAKPRIVVRQVTAITLSVLVLALFFGGDYFTPMTTVVGQLVSAVLIFCYLAALLALQHMSLPRRRERFLAGGGS